MLIYIKDMYNVTERIRVSYNLYEANSGKVLCRWRGSAPAKYWRLRK